MKKLDCFKIFSLFLLLNFLKISPVNAQKISPEELDLNPEIINNSPVLQQWLKETPNVLETIKHQPSFSPVLRFGYSYFPSTEGTSGLNIALDDLFLSDKGLTISGDYETSFQGDRVSTGANLAYYLLPMGNYVNIATVVGYRYLKSNNYETDGVNLGLKLKLAFSPGGGGDITLSQSFISPTGKEEVGITSLSIGYAITKKWRISTDIKKENSHGEKDSRVGINLEFLLKK